MRLFGKIGISILLLFITFSCEEEVIQSIPVEQEFPFEISAADYSSSHFFLDTIYRHIFEDFHKEYPPYITSEMVANEINEVEVWILTHNIFEHGRRLAKTYFDLPSKQKRNSLYDSSSFTNLDTSIGKYEIGYFRRLEPGNEYRVQERTGILSFMIPLYQELAIAVSYSTLDNQYFGEFSGIDTNAIRPIILKLIKPININPYYKLAWDLMLKNIYKLDSSFSTLHEEDFDLEITFRTQNRVKDTLFMGGHLLRVVGFDNFADTGGATPDHRFDFLPMFTINKKYGEIIFPTLRPFDTGIKNYFVQNNPSVSVPDSLLFNALYDSMRTDARRSPKNRFFIKWRIQNH
ncbi:MAG: hypothetical protein HYZ33_02975 [Ignavibacteriales bacterium]|nr:hypothetical protein [Ignavibacteriales bacterium]